MASVAVRNWFRSKVTSPGISGCPYHDTVNRVPDKRTLSDLPIWCTLEFQNPIESRLTLGPQATFVENGQVNVIVLGKSGKGDAPVLAKAELFRQMFQSIHEQVMDGPVVLGYMHIDAPEPPSTDATESGDWFLASVSCAYTFEVTR